MDAQQLLLDLRRTYAAAANPEDAVFMKRYMKDQFEFFGIKKPERQQCSARFIQEHQLKASSSELPQLCRLCFGEECREIQYFVNDLLQPMLRRLDESYLALIDELIERRSWWDTVDFLSPKLAGSLLLRFPDQIGPLTGRWIASDNFWYQRAALLFQLNYKDKTDVGLLFDYIRRRADSREFFVQKASGWALRELSKKKPELVRHFIENTRLSPLTKREGLKWMERKESQSEI